MRDGPRNSTAAAWGQRWLDTTPPRRIAWRAHPVPIGMGIHAALDFELAPTDDGGTRLTQHIRMHEAWLTAHVLARLMFHTNTPGVKIKARAQWQASLANIKAILEEPPTARASETAS